jgi:hypothetical protein
MASGLNRRGWGALFALLLLLVQGSAAAGEQPAAPRYPAIVIYVGAG